MKLLLLLSIGVLVSSVAATCSYTDEECEFHVVIEQRLTMMKESDLVYLSNGKLYKYDVVDESSAEPISLDDVITADGHHEPRVVAVVNGTMPGPEMIVYEDQSVVVHVHNKLISDSISIHFHGYPQVGTPWMDGASFTTQCPIHPGQHFTYRVKAHPAGTYFYHAHSGTQTAMGIFGAFIVRRRNALKMPEHIMMVQSWDHNTDGDKQVLQSKYGVYNGRQPENFEELIDGTFTAYRTMTSGMINGRGRYYNKDGQHNGAPLTVYNIEANSLNRFRVIVAGMADPFVISVDQHRFDIIAIDGRDIEPVNAGGFVLNSGERIDFVIRGDQPVGNYWIRAETLTKNKVLVEAILRYNGAPNAEPTSVGTKCTEEQHCTVVNCPFKKWPQHDLIDCIPADYLREPQNAVTAVPEAVPGHFKEYFLNFVYHYDKGTGAVNGKQFKQPSVPPLTQPSEFTSDCDQSNCGVDRLCHCTQTLNIGNNDTVQFVLTNIKNGEPVAHPIHLHGHQFHVLKIGYPEYDDKDRMATHNKDIECEGDAEKTLCNKPTWSDKTWFYGNVPGINIDRPPRKDTITIPAGGYVIIRIKANNPGVWAFHCHVENHNVGGMKLFLNESFPEQPSPPEGFPQCRDYPSGTYTPRQQPMSKMEASDEDSDKFTKEDFWKLFIVMVVVIFVQFVITVGVFGCVHFRSRKSQSFSAILPPSYEKKI